MDLVKMNEARSIRVLRWLRSDLRAALSLAFLVLLLLLSVTAPWIAPHAPSAQNLDATLQPISGAHWLGTD
ncbi:ABC transporter permease, partial [Verminephrobacter sp. Larva24]